LQDGWPLAWRLLLALDVLLMGSVGVAWFVVIDASV
jgi:hypothetical protein